MLHSAFVMEIRILYFAHVKALIGIAQSSLAYRPGMTAGDVLAHVVEAHPEVAPLQRHLRVAVDGVYVALDAPVGVGSEVALIPPVAGGSGMRRVDIVSTPLTSDTLEALSRVVMDGGRGALVTFSGVVRDHARGREVTELKYEAYEAMAISELSKVVESVESDYPSVVAAVHHRVGHLVVGATAVQIAVASAPREQAFEACKAVIDRLKRDVPIWKYEVGPDGESWVTERP